MARVVWKSTARGLERPPGDQIVAARARGTAARRFGPRAEEGGGNRGRRLTMTLRRMHASRRGAGPFDRGRRVGRVGKWVGTPRREARCASSEWGMLSLRWS